MRTEISSLDLYYITKELQALVNGRVDKVYQRESSFLFTVHVTGKGKKLLKVMPNLIYLTEYKEEFPETPPGFCKFLRKHLANSRLRKIIQKGFERILELEFETKEKTLIMIIELFASGNLVLCDHDYKVMSALHSHKWKDRTVRGGIEYEFPPEQRNAYSISEQGFKKVIDSSEKDSVVKTLAVDLSLGGLYAEELCLRSKVDKTAGKLSTAEKKTMYSELKKLFSKKINANIVGEEILPFELKTFLKEEKQNYETFSQAIDSKFSEKLESDHKEALASRKNAELEKVNAIINQQEQTIKGLKMSIDENQRKGEFIYENYEQVKSILEDMGKARKKFSWEEIKERLKGHKAIKEVKEKEGKIIIEI